MNKLPDKSLVTYILLACCTCKRPNMLKDMLNSLNELLIPEDTRVELLIVDNDSNQTAKSIIEEFQAKIKFKIHYVVENERGLANARNRILEEAIKLNASHILMFDDDEILTPNALTEHINLYTNNENCYISSGIVLNQFAENAPNYVKKNIVFKQKTTKKTGQIKKYCASGNVFFPVSMIRDNNLRFLNEYKFMGGEDGAFFKEASELGYTIIQNSNSLIYENVTEARVNLQYILKKAYYNGYSGSYLKFKQKGLIHKIPVFYVIKSFIVLSFNCICLIPTVLLGKTVLINVLAMCYRTCGKIVGAIKTTPLDFYKEVYGE